MIISRKLAKLIQISLIKVVTEIMHPFKILKWVDKTMIMTKDSPFGKCIDKIYTIGYYTGFYSSLSYKI